jgi:hypothetical protein
MNAPTHPPHPNLRGLVITMIAQLDHHLHVWVYGRDGVWVDGHDGVWADMGWIRALGAGVRGVGVIGLVCVSCLRISKVIVCLHAMC